MARGRFISVEGGEGAGKSTQLKLLAQSFTQAGIVHCCTREPGGTESAEHIRKLLVTGETDRWLPQTEALLIMAARYEHVNKVVEPALGAGTWVLCDRFFDSTRVYQGWAKQLGDDWLCQLYRLLFGNITPDLTLYLDIDAQEGLARTQTRSGNETRFEKMDLSFHETLRTGFAHIAQAEPHRVHVIDASGSLACVHQTIVQTVSDYFSIKLSTADAAHAAA